jgi:hypothetical protein
MYISRVFVTALAATSTAQAFNVRDEASAVAANTKRSVKSMLGWLHDMLNNNGIKKEDESECPLMLPVPPYEHPSTIASTVPVMAP